MEMEWSYCVPKWEWVNEYYHKLASQLIWANNYAKTLKSYPISAVSTTPCFLRCYLCKQNGQSLKQLIGYQSTYINTTTYFQNFQKPFLCGKLKRDPLSRCTERVRPKHDMGTPHYAIYMCCLLDTLLFCSFPFFSGHHHQFLSQLIMSLVNMFK